MTIKNITQSAVFIVFCFFASSCEQRPEKLPNVDVVLIGGGIMSATLGALLHELDHSLSIAVFEKLDAVALESSAAENNAGTGHAAFAELNYTPQQSDGSINIAKAIEIAEGFEISKQFWAYEVSQKNLPSPEQFINNVPHMSFVCGDENTAFLKKRYQALVKSSLFESMKYSEDPEKISLWAPLLMDGRVPGQKVAATLMNMGTDVNFGALTRGLFDSLKKLPQVTISVGHDVLDLKQRQDGTWDVLVGDLRNKNRKKSINTKFVFIGAGGGALKLLQLSDIPESKGFAGFPVGGAWLVSDKKELIDQHNAKVYGQASVGAPPMSVPHLDSRFIDGKEALLFGPFATYSTKFLKYGSWLDLPSSITLDNAIPMISVGLHNFNLISYLIGQVLMSPKDRLAALREYVPRARLEDWHREIAGQRVQIIKKSADGGGTLQFGTETVVSQDKSLAALLGASPGASIAVKVMLDLLSRVYPKQIQSPEWQSKLIKMIPSYGQSLAKDPQLLKSVRSHSREILRLKH